jgi:formylglycine-generating enzyme required for sulfatase activity
MEENNDSCCSPQRPESSVDAAPQEFVPSGISSNPDFVSIPAGEFIMGTDEPFYPTDGEGPSRSIWLDEFKISRFSVTNSQFAKFIEATGYVTEAETYGWSYVFNGFIDEATSSRQSAGIASSAPWWLAVEGASWFQPFGNSQTIESILDHPVVHVTHTDALEFCRWSGYKLPTEAQWEKASRGGLVGTYFPWGDELLEGEKHNTNIWQGEFPQLNTQDDGFFGTAPVNSFRPNNFGLYNTVGNVWEWTSDFWSTRWHIPNTEETRKNPAGPYKDAGNRVLKGGSFMCHDSYCFRYRNSARTYNSPNTSTSHIGFRCVL